MKHPKLHAWWSHNKWSSYLASLSFSPSLFFSKKRAWMESASPVWKLLFLSQSNSGKVTCYILIKSEILWLHENKETVDITKAIWHSMRILEWNTCSKAKRQKTIFLGVRHETQHISTANKTQQKMFLLNLNVKMLLTLIIHCLLPEDLNPVKLGHMKQNRYTLVVIKFMNSVVMECYQSCSYSSLWLVHLKRCLDSLTIL